jgi:3-methyladenine DNA glycosylase/8-oxoguanine DNA glycosylase
VSHARTVKVNPDSASWRLDGPLDLIGNTGAARVGRADPTGFVRDGRVWHAAYYASGPAALSVWIDGGTLRAEAWGDGAADALAAVPDFVGLTDDPTGFDPSPHPLTRDLCAQHPGARLIRTRNIFDALVPTILGQKVTAVQALRSYQTLVRRVRVRAPLPHVSRRPLLMPPTPDEVLTALSGHGAATLAIDSSRTAAIREVALLANRFDALAHRPGAEVRAALEAIPGIGVWTANHVSYVAVGDADAVWVGDYHLKNIVGFALTGAARSTDDEMVAMLEPFRPHRARVLRLIGLSGLRAPRYGAKTTVPTHLPLMTSHRPSRDAANRSPRSRTRRRTR